MLFHLVLLSVYLVPFISAFTHPGLLVNDADITRIKLKLRSQLDPWQASWDKLIAIEYSQSTYLNNAVSYVHRGTDPSGVVGNGELLWHDAAAAFNLGLRWKIEGKEKYAAAATAILEAWALKLTSLDVTDEQYLFAGLQGYQLVNAAELLRDYAPFTQNVLKPFTEMFESVFLAKNVFFLEHRAGSQHNVRHFFANWELGNIASALAFGIFTDNSTLYEFAIDYFKNGDGNGAVNIGISNLVTEPGTGKLLGQIQESGRDQGHTGLDMQLFAVVAQQAWNQGEDLYGYNNSRILLGAEYYARYNLGNDVPFEPYTNGIVHYTQISSASRGAFRPTWELLYAHYGQIKGLDAPWTEQYKNYTVTAMGGFEGGGGSWGEGSGHYDGLGWGSLLYHLDADDVAGLQDTPTSSSATTTATLPSSATSATNIIPSHTAKHSHYHHAYNTSVTASADTSIGSGPASTFSDATSGSVTEATTISTHASYPVSLILPTFTLVASQAKSTVEQKTVYEYASSCS